MLNNNKNKRNRTPREGQNGKSGLVHASIGPPT